MQEGANTKKDHDHLVDMAVKAVFDRAHKTWDKVEAMAKVVGTQII